MCYVALAACDCHVDGSSSRQCDVDGKCSCKANVKGRQCNQCKAGFFGLAGNLADGCQGGTDNTLLWSDLL